MVILPEAACCLLVSRAERLEARPSFVVFLVQLKRETVTSRMLSVLMFRPKMSTDLFSYISLLSQISGFISMFHMKTVKEQKDKVYSKAKENKKVPGIVQYKKLLNNLMIIKQKHSGNGQISK